MGRDVQVVLRDHLREFLMKGDRQRSIAGLARRAVIAELTLRRILQGESQASFETSCKLLKITAESPEEIIRILEASFPDMAEAIDMIKMHGYTESHNAAIERFQATTPSCLILSLASMRGGVSSEEIEREFGKSGSRATEEMLTAGILDEKDGLIRTVGCVDPKNMRTSLAKIKHITDAIDPILPAQMAFLHSERWNKKGVNLIFNTMNELSARFEELKQNPEYRGDYPVVVCGVIGRLTDKEGE